MSDGLYLIIQGRVRVTSCWDFDVPVIEYSNGSYIGDQFFLHTKFQREFKVCSQRCQIFFIPKNIILKILVNSQDKKMIRKLRVAALFRLVCLETEEMIFKDCIIKTIKKIFTILADNIADIFRGGSAAKRKTISSKKNTELQTRIFKDTITKGIEKFCLDHKIDLSTELPIRISEYLKKCVKGLKTT